MKSSLPGKMITSSKEKLVDAQVSEPSFGSKILQTRKKPMPTKQSDLCKKSKNFHPAMAGQSRKGSQSKSLCGFFAFLPLCDFDELSRVVRFSFLVPACAIEAQA